MYKQVHIPIYKNIHLTICKYINNINISNAPYSSCRSLRLFQGLQYDAVGICLDVVCRCREVRCRFCI